MRVLLAIFCLLWAHAEARVCPDYTSLMDVYEGPDGTDQLFYFSHIPKAGGRIVSWWLLKAYGYGNVMPGSKSASVFLTGMGLMDQINNREPPYAVAYSHDRIYMGVHRIRSHLTLLNHMHGADKQVPPPRMILVSTFLRDVVSHRMSMLRKYIFRHLWIVQNFGEGYSKKEQKQILGQHRKEIKAFNPSFRDWAYMEDKAAPWQQQTYSLPDPKPQNIGVDSAPLHGRSYQLKWVANSRMQPKNVTDECDFKTQTLTSVETCDDDRLLRQGTRALENDLDFFGLINRFQESMCMLHYHLRVPWPPEEPTACGLEKRGRKRGKGKEQAFPKTIDGSTDWAADRTDGFDGNFSMQYRESLTKKCLSQDLCEPDYVCPAHMSSTHMHSYKSDPHYADSNELIQEIEQPELTFMAFADELFERRYQELREHVQCQLEQRIITGSEDWFGPGCFK